MFMPKFAIVAAMEREVWPLIKSWQVSERDYQGASFKFFEHQNQVVICGGIRGQAARRATEAILALYRPQLVQSVGFAGALDRSWKVGAIMVPASVVDAQDGSRVELEIGEGVLVSVAAIAGVVQKKKLAKSYGAQAVDMEAAAVAKGARARGVAFSAVKVISDEIDFELPAMERFIGADGGFNSRKFVMFVAIRPWLWARVWRLRSNSRTAAEALCRFLAGRLKEMVEELDNSAPKAHPISKAGV
jgi:adenosylhomocysteine nucleosidase